MRHARLVPRLIVLLVALACVQSAGAADPTLYVTYSMNCTFTITGDNGTPITVIPPGYYQVLVTSPQPFAEPDLSGQPDPNVACGGSLSFQLTGPGVNIHTTLEDGDSAAEQFQGTFQVGTYVAQENRRPTVTRTVFTVSNAAAGTGGTGGGSSGSSSGSTSTAKSNDKSNVNSDPVGSTVALLRGTLNGDVSTTGKLILQYKGKPVSKLKSGRYKISVLDETSKTGFTLQRLAKQTVTVKLTGASFVGKRTVTVTMKPGQWSFSSPTGKKSYFIVVG